MRKVEWTRKTMSVVLLAVVLPISITVAFLFGGGTRIAENITLDAVVWTFQRPHPSQYVLIDDMLESTYSSDGLSAVFYLGSSDYLPKIGSLNFDTLQFRLEINATATNPNSFIESIHIVLRKDQTSTVYWVTTEFDLENLSLVAQAYAYEWQTQAYIKLAGVNHTSNVYASAVAGWTLESSNTQSHQLEIIYEIVYYNGTAYNKIVQPFQLNILGAEE